MRKVPAAKDPTRNVWLQLGFPDAEEHFLKAELVLRLDKAITSLGLTQRAAARRIGATQPELSKILGGKFTEVSLELLMRFLTALGCHIEIKIGAGRKTRPGKSPSRMSGARPREQRETDDEITPEPAIGPRFARTRWAPIGPCAASERQNHATSPSALATFVRHALRVHRIPSPRFVTIGRNVLCV